MNINSGSGGSRNMFQNNSSNNQKAESLMDKKGNNQLLPANDENSGNSAQSALV